ncbi:MAG: phosphotransferase [Bacteroidales bacterium]|nr:phosphotransferase [Bacteroidales bacterium]
MEKLFQQWAGEPCLNITQITANGSNRLYYRLQGESKTCIAAVNDDVRENEAFFYFADALKQRGINVPQVYAVSDDRRTYLQQDLGNITLYTYITSRKSGDNDLTQPLLYYYRKAIDQLVKMQVTCGDVDFSYSYPRANFDRQAIQWDLNYFKYYFLRLFHIPYDEQLLEDDFQSFIDYLLESGENGFMFRDFQSRNIMIVDDELYFIDFQGARKGAPHYDLASLLYSSKSDLPDNIRQQLLDYYIERKSEALGVEIDRKEFMPRFYGYVLARMMQAMGAYGFRGKIEKKEYFVKSIPFAVNNLRNILSNVTLPVELPHLREVWDTITKLPEYSKKQEGLTVSIFSFSYRKSIPFDNSGNGGGYVFDCRGLANPGLYDEYKEFTGKDQKVIDFFEQHPETQEYLQSIYQVLGFSIESYISRGYTRLMVSFGCTGGRHRSVYCAEQTAQYIAQNYDCNVTLHHIEQSKPKKQDNNNSEQA